MSAFDEVAEAISRRDYAGALELALAEWRTTRYAELGNVITWLAQKTNSTFGEVTNIDLIPRNVDPDPRIADALVEFAAKGIYASYAGDDYQVCGELLIRHGDARHRLSLQRVVSNRRALRISRPDADTLHLAGYQLGKRVPAMEVGREWEELIPKRIASKEGERLIEELLDDPWNDELAQVIADRLIEIGDPRGEFISLQRMTKPPVDVRRRIRELQKKHSDDWLGPDLCLVLSAVRFRDGFPVHATLRYPPSRVVWERVLADKRLRTFERIHKGKAPKWALDEIRAAIEEEE